ncbi:uncharacterized protein K452DRAFT_238870 [Aplosporella prunicola CBS 121167]|uniref:NAD(P)-binding protein n=1 Tax=Aplosporella prunicola CBS 121167 TaxID=1176127 RepID=A0A6A6AWB1_9PEZI|nr:uncharacterized protein K452DRAFT_330160 [Aplosporella prunicola CBS 121167]XP_033391406.1 uncharacterized protein K452DRAFT_238870 [Aplosporella prunicola CBS 121167]KAF2135548.1 hypothetical protein K452DRAFT_330160 [Aplosporella prunicola CBS 121167]KAF2135688.1 hypothetical protein K452DRAFT_238870 [Aplosporella prunicola CBS 121167]
MSLSKPWALVSPASRGIGQALARRILQTTRTPVIATSRTEPDEARERILEGLGHGASDRLRVIQLDFCSEESISSAASTCFRYFPPKEGWHLHLAMVIPGVLFPEKSPAQISSSDALLTFQTNSIGPLLAIKHFHQFLPRKSASLFREGKEMDIYDGLPKQAIWTSMSARVGSISDNGLGGWYSYRASKAAVNQIIKTFDNHLKATSAGNAMAVGLHPGTVKTDFSKEFWGNVRKEKLFEKEFAAQKLLEVVIGLELENGRGRCWDWKGEEVPP